MPANKQSDEQHGSKQDESPSIFQFIKSALGALIGVQSDKTRERDFKTGKPGDFILIGIVVSVLFVLSIIMVVSSVVDGK